MHRKKGFTNKNKQQFQNVSRIYWAFASIRVILTLLPQTGYIHPDEFFQSIEISSGKRFINLPIIKLEVDSYFIFRRKF